MKPGEYFLDESECGCACTNLSLCRLHLADCFPSEYGGLGCLAGECYTAREIFKENSK